MANLTYTDCLRKIREHRARGHEHRKLADHYLALSREHEADANGCRELAQEWAGLAREMRADQKRRAA